MSAKPAQSHLLEHVASRRNVVRSAAWTTAAVTIVVATPNIAAATPGSTPPGSASTTGSTRDGKTLNLKSTFTAGAQAVTGLQATVTVVGGAIATITADGWTLVGTPSGSTATFTYSGTVVPNGAAPFQPVVTLTTNPTATVTSTVNFTWTTTGTAPVSIPLAYAATSVTTAVGSPRKYSEAGNSSVKHVEWAFTLTAGSQSIPNLNLDFLWSTDGGRTPATRFTVTSPQGTWTTTLSGLLADYKIGGVAAGLAPGQSLSITADMVNGDNSGGALSVVVKSGATTVASVGPVSYN